MGSGLKNIQMGGRADQQVQRESNAAPRVHGERLERLAGLKEWARSMEKKYHWIPAYCLPKRCLQRESSQTKI